MVYKFIHGRIAGIPNKDITPEDIARLGAILGSWYGKGTLVVSGRDYSPASRMLKRALLAGLVSTGVDVMDFHESFSGEIAFAIKRFGARGGVNVSGYPVIDKHIQFRIYTNPGYEIIGERLDGILKNTVLERVDPRETGWITYAEYIHKLYMSSLTSFVDTDPIANAGLRIAIDLCNGPVDKILLDLLNEIGVEAIVLGAGRQSSSYWSTYPYFDRIKRVSDIVRTIGLDLGIVLNNDGSAVIVVDENGKPLLPEETCLVLLSNLSSGSQVVASKDTLSFLKQEARNIGVEVTRYGMEEEVIETCARERPALCLTSIGEYIHPLFSLGYDAVLTLLLILETLALTDKPLSKILGRYKQTRYYVLESNRDLREIIEKLCRVENIYCRPYMAGYRVLVNNVSTVVTQDPITETTRILIDSYTSEITAIVNAINNIIAGTKQ